MESIARLSDHIRRTYDGPMWHGPALSEILDDLSFRDAAARPVAHAHSIWELVLHMAAWAEIGRERLNGRSLQSPPQSGDWPPTPTPSGDAWPAAIARLSDAYHALAREAASLSDADLVRIIPSSTNAYSVSELLHGVVEHGTYHGGQIVLLKRAAAARTT